MKRRTKRGLALAAAAASAALALLATAALAAGGGNAATLRLYQRSRTAMAAYGGISFLGAGTSYRVTPQRGGYDNFQFDFGAVPAGYRRAIDHVLVVQAHGRVREEVDTLRAPGLPALRIWQTGVLELGEVLTKHPCAEIVPKNNASYVSVGRPFVVFTGRYRFAALRRSGGGAHAAWLVRSSYPLAGGTAHEQDLISARTLLWRRSHLIVRGGPYRGNFLTEYRFSYRRVQAFVPPPAIGRCG